MVPGRLVLVFADARAAVEAGGVLVIALIGTVLVFWIARAYAEVISTAVGRTRVVSAAEVRRIMVEQ